MADKSQSSAEDIASEIESLRQQMRSFAMQRAEGLIDANLQRDLVDDLKARIVDLEKLQNSTQGSSANSNHGEVQMVEEMLTADATDTKAVEDTHEHPEIPPVSEPSDEPEHGEAQVIDELFAKGDTYEFREVTPVDEILNEGDYVETQEQSEIALVIEPSDEPEHGEAQVIDELFAKGDTYEFNEVTSIDETPDEGEQVSDEPEPAKEDESKQISSDEDEQTSDEPELAKEDESKQISSDEDEQTSDDPKPIETQMVKEMLTVEAPDTETDEDSHEEPDAPPVIEASAESQNIEGLVIEEDHNPLHHDEDAPLTLGDFVEDIVVSSAMVKEPGYLDSIHEPNVVDIRDITKTYQMGELELEVLKGITLQVHQGELIAIMGPSGSGKSTLMNILGALDKPTAGEYFLDGVDVSKMKENQLAEIRNQKIGFVFQSFNLLKRTSAIRQVELPLIYGSHKDRTRLAREALEAVGLGERLDHTPAELSGGQQQRVAIARALVTEPSLILADEPTGNLDSRSGTEVMQIFQNLNRKNNITTILVTHDVWIARHTDRVIMLRDGKIIADQRVKNPLVAGEAERPTETQELQALFDTTYSEGDEEEYT